jgi:hypothetical protein
VREITFASGLLSLVSVKQLTYKETTAKSLYVNFSFGRSINRRVVTPKSGIALTASIWPKMKQPRNHHFPKPSSTGAVDRLAVTCWTLIRDSGQNKFQDPPPGNSHAELSCTGFPKPGQFQLALPR